MFRLSRLPTRAHPYCMDIYWIPRPYEICIRGMTGQIFYWRRRSRNLYTNPLNVLFLASIVANLPLFGYLHTSLVCLHHMVGF